MRVALLAIGSRGDVQPFIALGLALRERGHSLRLCAAADYEELVEGYGLPYAAVGGSIAAQMDLDAVRGALAAAGGRLPLGFARSFVRQVEPALAGMARDCLEACQGAELIVASSLGVYLGAGLAERLGVPLVPAHFHPTGASAAYPDVSFAEAPGGLPLRGWYNRATHALAAHALWQLLAAPLGRAARAAVGLPPMGRGGLWRLARRAPPLALYGYSERLAPRPPDWPGWRRITGPWLVGAPEGYEPPAELARFLAAGPPPVYVGFGSVLAGADPAAVAADVVAALGRAGRRGLLYRGAWGDLAAGELPATVLRLADVPHQWLFPRVAAVVTHGGAGTLAAALAAGAPAVVVPAFGDQRLWGRRVAELGAGPPPIPRGALTAARLAEAIAAAAEGETMRRRAAELGAAMLAEGGAARAAALIEGLGAPGTG